MRSNLFQATSKMVALARAGEISIARKLFDELPERDTVAWNAMLSSYSQLGWHREALCLFKQLRISSAKPDQFTFTAALSASASARDVRYGMLIHGLVVVCGCEDAVAVNNSLIDMYGKCRSPCSSRRVFEEMSGWNEVSWCSMLFAYTNSGLLDVAAQVFHAMPRKVRVSWNIIIAGHAQYGNTEPCLILFREMRENNCCPDQWTLNSLMKACTIVEEPCLGHMIHGYMMKSGFKFQSSILSFYSELGSQGDVLKVLETIETTLDQVSWNAVIDAHMKLGNTHEAFLLFQQAPENNVVSWTIMIAGFARSGHEREALCLFADMRRTDKEPDELTFGAVLLACSSLAVLGHGMAIHGCLIQYGFEARSYVGNGLVNMYTKCGDLQASSRAFIDIAQKDLVSFNAMLFAYGLHGWATRALQLYDDMILSGITPDEVTFIGLLTTCSHAGLIERGQLLYESMHSIHGLTHEMHHVACIVDMLSRGGFIPEARSLAINYYEGGRSDDGPDGAVLVGACSGKV
ncbi:hypothetical protein Dimus_001293 [Dionaea muscipula]